MSDADRLALLRRAIRNQPGPWRTAMVQHLYRAHGIAPFRRTAKRDLSRLHHEGLLTLDDRPGDRTYTLNTKGGAS